MKVKVTIPVYRGEDPYRSWDYDAELKLDEDGDVVVYMYGEPYYFVLSDLKGAIAALEAAAK